jgi:hypothetical protein
MTLMKGKKGQSILEYAVLIAIVIVGVLIMQIFIKRGYQGSLKDSADKMGDQFSAGNTAIYRENSLTGGGKQIITEGVAIGGPKGSGIKAYEPRAKASIGYGAYSYTERKNAAGTKQVSTVKVATDSIKDEKTGWTTIPDEEVTNFKSPL